MAYVYKSQLDEEAPQGASPAASSAGASSAPPASTAGSTGGSPSAGAAPQALAGNYPMITQYLNANKDQGSALAADVAGQVGKEVQDAKDSGAKQAADWTTQNQGAVDSWRQQNQGAYDAWRAQRQADQQKAQDALASSYETFTNRVRGNGTDQGNGPTDNALNRLYRIPLTNAVNTYQSWRGNLTDFTPTDAPTLTDWRPDTTAATKASADLSALGTDQGRETFLAQRNGGGAVPSGVNQLDAALLGRGLAGNETLSGYGDMLSALRNPGSPTAPALDRPDFATPDSPSVSDIEAGVDAKKPKGGTGGSRGDPSVKQR